MSGDKGFARMTNKYKRDPALPECPDRVRNIGELEGTWFEMGAQYGERVGNYIQHVFNNSYSNLRKKLGKKHLLTDIHRYEKAISDLSPSAMEFMRGISEGASKELDRSPLSDSCSDYEKILLIGCRNEIDFRHPRWLHEPTSTINHAPGCSSIAVVGELGGVKFDETIIAQNNDGPFGLLYNVSYVANPVEPKARRFWAIGLAGQLTYTQVNDKGVAITETAGGFETPMTVILGCPGR